MAPSLPVIEQTIGHRGLQSWSYLVACPETRRAVLVDCGGSHENILAMAREYTVERIVLTHGHLDHWEGAAAVKRALNVPVAAHAADFERIGFTPDGSIDDGETIAIGQLTARVLHTPGHTTGSVCLLLDGIVLTGDTLFPGGPGRTQRPEDLQQIIASITTRLHSLPEGTRLFPGHGVATTIGESRAEYAGFAARAHAADLCGDVSWSTS